MGSVRLAAVTCLVLISGELMTDPSAGAAPGEVGRVASSSTTTLVVPAYITTGPTEPYGSRTWATKQTVVRSGVSPPQGR